MDTQHSNADQEPDQPGWTYRYKCDLTTNTVSGEAVPVEQAAAANPQGGSTAAPDTQGSADLAQGPSGGSSLAHFDTAAQQAGASGLLPHSSSAAVHDSTPHDVLRQPQQQQHSHAGVGVFQQQVVQPQQPVAQPQQQHNSSAQQGLPPSTFQSDFSLWTHPPPGFGTPLRNCQLDTTAQQQELQPPSQQDSPLDARKAWEAFQSVPQASRQPVSAPFVQQLQQVVPGLTTGPQLPDKPASNANAGGDAGT